MQPRLYLMLIAVVLTGCQGMDFVPEPSSSTSTTTSRVDEAEPNGAFDDSNEVGLDADGKATLQGSIVSRNDVDVFSLGSVTAGDSITIDVPTGSAGGTPGFALFDVDGQLVQEHSAFEVTGPTSMEHIVRRDSSEFYVAFAKASSSAPIGDYEVTLDVQRGGDVPEPVAQTIYLNFAGGSVNDPIVGYMNFGVFDAADIDSAYEGRTDEIKATIKETFTQNYERFNIVLLNTDEHDRPAAGTYSEVFFGGYNSLAFGVAEDVDLYNANPDDHAIIFTESFTPEVFTSTPTVEEMGLIIGNVASHEAGHLLGLHHVRDPFALMDEASPAYTLMFDQEFKYALLSPLIFPLGYQDSSLLLEAVLGRVSGESSSKNGSMRDAYSWFDMDAEAAAANFLSKSAIGYCPKGGKQGKCLTCLTAGSSHKHD